MRRRRVKRLWRAPLDVRLLGGLWACLWRPVYIALHFPDYYARKIRPFTLTVLSGWADKATRERREATCRRCPWNKRLVSWRWRIEFCDHPGCGCPKRWWWPFSWRRIKVRFRGFSCPAGAPQELFPRAWSPVDSARWQLLRLQARLRRMPEVGELIRMYRWLFEPLSNAVRPPFK